MLQFQLFRVRVQLPRQASLFSPNQSPAEILMEAVREKPSAELRTGYKWHLGNLADIDKSGVYFALGRTTRAMVEIYDDEKGEFVETEFETAPYTHVLLETRLQVAALASKARLAPTTAGLGRQLGRLLNESERAKRDSTVFEISSLSDPHDFIHHLHSSYAVTKFSLTFSRPNPIDVDELYQKPMERLLEATDGNHGQARLEGKRLDPAALADLTRSVAASGEDATATVLPSEESKPVVKHLRGDPVVLQEDSLDSSEEKHGFLEKVRQVYSRIRHAEDGGESRG